MDTMRVRDLVGVPYLKGSSDPARGLDCWGSVVEFHRRMGHGEIRPDPALWEPLGCDLANAREDGDVATGENEAGGLTCAVLVTGSPKLWLTSVWSHGVRLGRATGIAKLRGVYRWRGSAAAGARGAA